MAWTATVTASRAITNVPLHDHANTGTLMRYVECTSGSTPVMQALRPSSRALGFEGVDAVADTSTDYDANAPATEVSVRATSDDPSQHARDTTAH